LVPARKQPGLKAPAFSPAWLVPVAETGINGIYKPGLKAFFSPLNMVAGRGLILDRERGEGTPSGWLQKVVSNIAA
jgi:hypothetical protein